MTQRTQKLRERIAIQIFHRFTNGLKPWERCTQKHKDMFLKVADQNLQACKEAGQYIEFNPIWTLTHYANTSILALDRAGVNKMTKRPVKGYLIFIEEIEDD